MSENKYIIDKDSLTGIADAVRDKLGGVGEATIDSQTGDIVYPEDKGYYLKQEKLAGFIYPGNVGSQTPFMNVSNETVQELCGGIVPTYIKFTVLTLASSCRAGYNSPCGLSYNGTKFYSHAKGGYTFNLQNIIDSTKTISYNSAVGCQIIGTSGSYRQSYQTYSYFEYPGSIKIEFLDENENNILTSVEGPISAGLSSSNYTMEIPTSIAPAKIPFSIDDIQDKITNYLVNKTKPTIPIDYEGLSYSYVTGSGGFVAYGNNNSTCLTLIPLTSGQKIGFCIGETVSNRLRASFFSGYTYSDFSRYVTQPFGSSPTTVYTNGIGITGNSELSGDSLLKRFYYTAPADGELVVGTSGESVLAFLHVWEVTE